MSNQLFLYVGLVALAVLVVGVLAAPVLGYDLGPPDRYHEVCQDEFGPGYTYEGWMTGNPPIVQCKGPNGQSATMDMPEWMAEEMGLEAAAYHG